VAAGVASAMAQRLGDSNNSVSAPKTAKDVIAERATFKLPIDFDDVLAIAIFDSILRGRRKKTRGRGAARRPK